MHQLATNTSNSLRRFILKSWLNRLLTLICMTEWDKSSAQVRSNRLLYRSLTVKLHALQSLAEDAVSHILYRAMLCYNAGNYNQTLRLVQLSKRKISDPYSINSKVEVSEEEYRQAGGENVPIETMLRKRFLYDINIVTHLYISEIYIECHSSIANSSRIVGIIYISPIICAFYLQYLCQRRLGCQHEADEAFIWIVSPCPARWWTAHWK